MTHAGVEVRRRLEAAIGNLSGRQWLAAFLTRYLKMSHCRELEDGCPLAALVSEVARADEPVKRSFEGMVRELEGQLAGHARKCDTAAARERALAALAMCVGGLGLARSVDSKPLADRILASCRKQAEGILCGEKKGSGSTKPKRSRKDL